MRFGVQLTQLFEGRDAGVGGDAGVRAAEEHPPLAEWNFLELAARLRVAFRPEIFTDFAALLHARKRAPSSLGWAKFLDGAGLGLRQNCPAMASRAGTGAST